MTANSHMKKSAILGGPAAVTLDQKEANRWPVITADDFQSVERVLADGKLNMHPVIREFEDACAAYFGSKYVLSHCNGTMALLACFFALDLQPGDEILVPSGTFWASVVPMLWVGAVPVFCESEPETLGIDPEDIQRKITPKTKAIVVVHLWGCPCKMEEIRQIADANHLKIIEDASHSQGAMYKGRKCGTLGDISAISLVGNKLLPGGEGGILLTDDKRLFERATCLGDIARIAELPGDARRFAVTGFGMKTRIASVSAAIAKSQLSSLDQRNRKRNGNIQYLSEKLAGLGFNIFQPTEADTERVYFENIIALDAASCRLSRELLVKALQAEGCIIHLPRYPLLHVQPIFQEGLYKKVLRLNSRDHVLPDYSQVRLPFIEGFVKQLLRLPTFPNAEQGLLDQYITAFEKVMAAAEEILVSFENGNIEIDPQDVYASPTSLLVL